MAKLTDNPAREVADAIVAHIQGLAPGLGIEAAQVRRKLDLSGNPKELAGVMVSTTDRGDHPGCVGRVLVDVGVEITAWTHLNDDADGSHCDAIAGALMAAMQTIDYALPDWHVAWRGSWSATAPAAGDAYRAITISATLPLVRRAGGDTSTSASTQP